MSTTAYQYRKVKELEEFAREAGFKIADSKFNVLGNQSDYLALCPADDQLPIYTRDATLIHGTVEELLMFLSGWSQSRQYLTFLGITDNKKIQRKEQDHRNKRLAEMIKYGKKD